MAVLKLRVAGCIVAVVVGLLVIGRAAYAADTPKGNGKLKVFILAGQSNMVGHGVVRGRPGQKGTLEMLTKNPATAARYKHLLGKGGEWVVREDVWIRYGEYAGALTIGQTAARNAIGPEFAFGLAVGDLFDEQVLLIKCCRGGTSLAGPWRPPSSGDAGERKRGEGGIGAEYDKMIAGVKRQLADIKTDFPSYDGAGYEIVGFGWHQGWNDGCSAGGVAEYEKNMANLIRDVRKDLGTPKLPVIIAGSGFGGWGQTISRRVGVMTAQAAVAQYGEFRDNVRYVETRSFFRDGDISPRPTRYHWCCNAESYYLIGEAMGGAMVAQLRGADGRPAPAAFADTFENTIAAGWYWLCENRPAWRLADGGLGIRVQPGVAHNVRNALVRTAPDRRKGAYTVDVTITNDTVPTRQYEQAGVTWYHNGRPVMKLVKERVDGKLYIIPGKKPMVAKTVQLRLVVSGESWTAQYRPDATGEFFTAGAGRLPAVGTGTDEISIQCYNGPPDAEHWVCFDDFRITPIQK